MKIGDAFPGQFLKASDLGDSRPVVAIDRVEMEDIGDDHKPVLYFVGHEKGLVLNKTNVNTLIGMTGTDETDDWKGTRIVLYKTKVDFQGRRVDAIRVEDAPVQKAKPGAKPKHPHEEPQDDSEPPF